MSLRLLLNENIPAVLVEALREAGHDVSWVRLISPGVSDNDVLQAAMHDRRICVTFDKDFGELAAARSEPNHGVILLRIPPPRTVETAKAVAAIVSARADWSGCFSVVEPGRIRMRALRS